MFFMFTVLTKENPCPLQADRDLNFFNY